MTVCVKLNIQNERQHGRRVHARQQMEHSEGDRAETIPQVTRVTRTQKIIEANYAPRRIVLSIY